MTSKYSSGTHPSMSDLLNSVQQQFAAIADINSLSCCVALSGGIDSTVLLHLMVQLRQRFPQLTLRALHVDHGMQPSSGAWARDCQKLCDALDVSMQVLSVAVERTAELGPEAAARSARYAALAQNILDGEVLSLAQHQDDQLETYLLQLMRGGGVHGLSAMPQTAKFAGGRLFRPLLATRRVEIEAYAMTAGLSWVEDPSNADMTLDRNYLRHEILPLFRDRWPSISATVTRSARYAAEAAKLNDELAALDAVKLSSDSSIDIPALLELSSLRQRNLVRFIIRHQGIPVPPESRLNEIWESILPAAKDARPEVLWSGGMATRYRERLFLLNDLAAMSPALESVAVGKDIVSQSESYPLELGGAAGRYGLQFQSGAGLSVQRLQWPLQLKFRSGGERIRPAGSAHHRSFKNLCQERGVLPWMRDCLPLLYSGDKLVAVGNLWLDHDTMAAEGEQGVIPLWLSSSPVSC
ncbi:MAG: tRNA lysidine(34) synthetase TilS [Gammaproteobacteria bacterium]|nr:tRNA lysidine(34) synthetase TilS [Gammaproteobacteria bacterium]